MKVFGFLVVLVMILPAAIGARFASDLNYYKGAQGHLNNWKAEVVDTMTIEEAISFRTSLLDTPEFDEYGDFVITRTKYSSTGFNQGLYWPSGEMVPLPVKFLPDHLSLERRGKDIFLSYVTKDSNGGYSIYYLPLPQISVTTPLPKDVTIDPLPYK